MNIEKVAINAIDTAAVGYEIYLATAKAMDVIQANANLDGKSKRDWVLAYIKGTINEVYTNSSYWSELLIKFINSIKTIYNIVKTR